MTGFIISRELIASAPPSPPPRLFIPSAHSACSSRLSVFSARMRPGHDTTNPPPPPPFPPRTAVSRRNFPDRRHDPAPPPFPPQLSIDHPPGNSRINRRADVDVATDEGKERRIGDDFDRAAFEDTRDSVSKKLKLLREREMSDFP